MSYRVFADIVVLVHLMFIVFVATGWLLVARWWRLALLHVPSVIWAVLIEFRGWYCPLTHLENWLRTRGGAEGYGGGFVDRYVVPIVYPDALTRGHQILLGVAVLGVNGAAYLWLAARQRPRRSTG